jgi:type I restriction enzyme S subunit
MSEWKEYKLGEIADVQTGPFGSQLHMSDYQDEGTPIITVEHLGDNRIIHNNLPLVGDDDKERLKKYVLKEGDIVFSRVGSVDRRAYVSPQEDGWLFSGRCLRVRPSQQVDAKFLSYYFGLEDFKETIRRIAVGATMPSINTSILKDVSILLPPLSAQNHIASILSSIDDKIDLLCRENATLKQMAEALFRHWFVKDAKEDWEDIPLGNVIKTTSGGTPSRKHSEYYENGTINWVKSKELNGTFISTTEELITKDAIAYSSAKLLPEKSVLIAMYGATVGEYGILSKPMTCNQAVCALIPNKNYPYTYLYVWTALMKEDFINLASGAAQQNISQDLIKQQIVCGDIDRIKQYDEIVRGYFEKMENNQKHIQTLIQTRDGLLSEFMSNPNIFGL